MHVIFPKPLEREWVTSFRLKVALLDISCSWLCYAGSNNGSANNYCCDWNQRFVCRVCTGSTERINRTNSNVVSYMHSKPLVLQLSLIREVLQWNTESFFADQWLDLVLPVVDCLCSLQIGSTFMYVSTICQFVFLCKLAWGLMYVPKICQYVCVFFQALQLLYIYM